MFCTGFSFFVACLVVLGPLELRYFEAFGSYLSFQCCLRSEMAHVLLRAFGAMHYDYLHDREKILYRGIS